MTTILSVKNLKKDFNDSGQKAVNVLNGISFDVEEADFIAIMGPSGSGKSTLLYNISGMDQPSSGEVVLEGQNIGGLNQVELADVRLHKFGYVFQQPHLIPSLTVKENIILAASIRNKKVDSVIDEKAKNLMELTGINELADRDTMSLSGGQAQRVSICRSFMNDPKLVFADEPTGSLNSKSSEAIMNLFVDINQKGSTIMIVTHDPLVAAKANQVWFLLDGVLYQKERLGPWDKSQASVMARKNKINDIMSEIEV
ncbi:ABC transporter ATP-binding protein [Streptococcus macacae]|uniref:ABC transporter, ATP-binding protein n=1 Tax=Streptococcus macacae NCTC 11558 TaxID=764298 RepID=G5JX02_9STRE|nr:ABC transporter ATP-binding protein [Streptococcus macacae]EHJ52709.1 ABC transporter, ATP-binding protein [Streptococcus macacae NCTC 11558]SUN79478.1 peptide ABC transporter ATPase [Streptococcus macacae NCTC 11558]